jgi:Mor family transcriptional regulator
MYAKGRHPSMYDPNNPRLKLGREKEYEIWKEYKTGKTSRAKLSIKYKVSQSIIRSIINSKYYQKLLEGDKPYWATT